MIDTNVLVSGVISPHGPPGRIMDAVLAKSCAVLYDDRILSEYLTVLRRPRFGFQLRDTDAFLDFVELSGEAVVSQRLSVVLPDASDLPFLEVAAAGNADALITGNVRHFTPRRGRHAVRINTPAEFIRVTERSEIQRST